MLLTFTDKMDDTRALIRIISTDGPSIFAVSFFSKYSQYRTIPYKKSIG